MLNDYLFSVLWRQYILGSFSEGIGVMEDDFRFFFDKDECFK